MAAAHRVRSSEWLVTINTNQKYSDRAALKAAALRFAAVLQATFGPAASVREITKILVAGDSFDEHVGRIHSDIVLENAWSGLHAHVQMRACHLTKLHVNIAALRRAVCGGLGLPNVYVDVRLVRNQSLAVRNYIFKNVRGKNLKLCDGQTDFPDTAEVTHTLSIAPLAVFSKPPV